MNRPRQSFSMVALPGQFAVVRLAPEDPVPLWAMTGAFFSVTKTDDELSIVCDQGNVPPGLTCSMDWSCLKVVGPFAFDETGVIAAITSAIAAAGIGVFVLSTFDGDHLLVKETDLQTATAALQREGHRVRMANDEI